MKRLWRDILSAALAALGGVIVFARLNDYSWWSLGGWKSAIGALAVVALAIMLTNVVELLSFDNMTDSLEFMFWALTATVVLASLLSSTATQTEFVWTAILTGAAWLTQMGNQIRRTLHHPHTPKPHGFSPA